MAKRTGPTNEHLKDFIVQLRQLSAKQEAPIWKRVANELERSTRQRRSVNLSRINAHSKENETVLVPGKVLASGTLEHPVSIVAWQFSKEAESKIKNSKSKAILISDFIKENPKGQKTRIMG
ncbi:50S ribosomal protein L18e [Nanoarchaeota archaeon]